MKEELRNTKRRLDAANRVWGKRLGFERLGLNVSHAFSTSYADAHHTVVAETEFNWEYRDGKITWYLPRCAAMSDAELAEAIVHELVHCLIASMEANVPAKHSKTNEFAVETVTQAILIAVGAK